MRFSAILGGAVFSATALAASYDDIAAIEAVGQHFFYTNNGSQFYLKGVAYQQNSQPNGAESSTVQYTDQLALSSSCQRDIPLMKEIYTNVIRVYSIDPTANHDDCMSQLASADIYVIADLASPQESIDSNDAEWNLDLYQRYASVIDAMSKYNNVIGFFAGNEVVEMSNQTASAAFVKAAVRDMKSYIKTKNYRSTLGVGYATADVPTRDQLAHYFACEPDSSDSTIDFWGYNVYSWCGFSNYAQASYGERYDFFSDYPVPAFFSEYGCIEGIPGGPTHRPFTEVAVLYGNLTPVFSGGIVYQWFQSANNYGLVTINGDDATPEPDFTSLQSELAKVTPSSTQSSAYTPSNTAPACPTTDSTWLPVASPLPPVVNEALCNCVSDNVTCAVTNTNETLYGPEFGYICGQDDGAYCVGIAHNSTTGQYGAISGCAPQQQLAFVANAYYLAQSGSNQASACDFNGLAATQSPKASGTCASLVSEVGAAGTGTVAAAGAGASSSSKGAAVGTTPLPSFFNFGGAFFVAYVVTAVISGVGIFVL
ncbi:Glucanosyltransferase-domain-containing protein [Xylariaceae sp. FL0804]|nr:Glucanosyltransferase-domain-containing protein [Xylariaceae sp. FL0804]